MSATASTSGMQASAAPGAQFDVFLSYSRRDRDFVERLHSALTARAKAVYVDWEDIPDWSPDYERELFAGIDASDTFLFVLSPDSLASPNCSLEVDRAVEQGKRISMVLRRDVDATAAPESLRKPQWLDFRDDGGFEEAATRLVDALGVDAEWARWHTWIGLRAGEWERRGRDSSSLLRGSDLREAEGWLAVERNEPAPTQLQSQYVLAGRLAATRRQRAMFGAVLGALAVAIGLSVFALLQRSQAISQRDKARRAQSTALAGQADATVNDSPDAALALAVQAARIAETRDAESALRTALASDVVRASLSDGRRADVSSAAFSPDGKLILTDGYTLRLWDSSSGRLVHVLPRAVGFSGGFADASFSRDGKLVLGDSGNHVGVWQVASGRILRTFNLDNGIYGIDTRGAVLSPDGKVVLGLATDGTARLLDRLTGRPLRVLREGPTSDYTVDQAVFSPNGRLVLAVGDDAFATRPARLWDRATGKSLRTLAANADGAIFSPDGRRVLVWSRLGRIVETATGRATATLRGVDPLPDGAPPVFSGDGKRVLVVTARGARIWDSATGRLLKTLSAPGVTTAAFGSHGRLVLTAGNDGAVRFWNTTSGRLVQMLRGRKGAVKSVALSPDGSTVLTVGSSGKAFLWDSTDGRALRTFRAGTTAPELAVFSADGKTLLTTRDGRIIELWNTATSARLRALVHTTSDKYDFISSAAFSLGGKQILVGHTDSMPQLWDSASGRRLRVLQGDLPSSEAIALSPDGRLAVGAGYGGAVLWDTETGRPVHVLRGHVIRHGAAGTAEPEEFKSVAFSPNGKVVLTGGLDGIARLWDASTGRELRALIGHAGAVRAAAFSHDGTLVITGNADRTARIWDAATGQELHSLVGHTGAVDAAMFSRDDALVLTASSEGTARVWDRATGIALRTFPSYGGPVVSAVFGSDGKFVLTASSDGTVDEWACDLCGVATPELLARATTRRLAVTR